MSHRPSIQTVAQYSRTRIRSDQQVGRMYFWKHKLLVLPSRRDAIARY